MQPSLELRANIKTEPPFTDWTPLALPFQKPLPDDKEYSFENTSAWLSAATFQAYLESQEMDAQQR
jgi:hypothetical protein